MTRFTEPWRNARQRSSSWWPPRWPSSIRDEHSCIGDSTHVPRHQHQGGEQGEEGGPGFGCLQSRDAYQPCCNPVKRPAVNCVELPVSDQPHSLLSAYQPRPTRAWKNCRRKQLVNGPELASYDKTFYLPWTAAAAVLNWLTKLSKEPHSFWMALKSDPLGRSPPPSFLGARFCQNNEWLMWPIVCSVTDPQFINKFTCV